MPRRKTALITIEEAKARFGEWRQNRRGKARIPAELWSAAVAVARKEGLNRTARELHVAWDDLKRRMEEPSPKPALPAFVELVAPPHAPLEECVVEFESSGGSKMRIQWKATAPPDWTSLLQAWRETIG